MARAKHGQDKWRAYHITTRTAGREYYLARPSEKRIVTNALAFYRERNDYKLFGFVIMDNHIHVVIQPSVGVSLSSIVRNLKAWTSRRNKTKPKSCALWERRYDDNRIDTQAELRSVLNYIHANPTRAKMVSEAEEFMWSSVHNYLKNGRELMEIDTDWWAF